MAFLDTSLRLIRCCNNNQYLKSLYADIIDNNHNNNRDYCPWCLIKGFGAVTGMKSEVCSVLRVTPFRHYDYMRIISSIYKEIKDVLVIIHKNPCCIIILSSYVVKRNKTIAFLRDKYQWKFIEEVDDISKLCSCTKKTEVVIPAPVPLVKEEPVKEEPAKEEPAKEESVPGKEAKEVVLEVTHVKELTAKEEMLLPVPLVKDVPKDMLYNEKSVLAQLREDSEIFPTSPIREYSLPLSTVSSPIREFPSSPIIEESFCSSSITDESLSDLLVGWEKS